VGAANAARPIRSIEDALTWGDEWVSAYADLYERADQLEKQVFMLQIRVVILEAEALLLRYDVAKALVKVPAEDVPA
jgi:hypothetical protein